MNKGGVSAVVATVLTLLVVVAAVAIVWTMIMPNLKKNISTISENPSKDSRLSIDMLNGYTFWDEDEKTACVQIKKEGNYDFLGAEIIFSIDGSSITKNINKSELPEINQEKTFCFVLDKKPKSVKIAPILVSGEKGIPLESIELESGNLSPELKVIFAASAIETACDGLDDDNDEIIDEGCICSGNFASLCDWCGGVDINQDGEVNNTDWNIIQGYSGRTDCSLANNWCNGADLNKNGEVGFSELVIYSGHINLNGCTSMPCDLGGCDTSLGLSSCSILPGCTWKVADCTSNENCSYLSNSTHCLIGQCSNYRCSAVSLVNIVSPLKNKTTCRYVECDSNADCLQDSRSNDCSESFCENQICVFHLKDSAGCSRQCSLFDNGECQISLKSSYPYYEETQIYSDFSSWTHYTLNGKNYLISPLIDAGQNNEMNFHKITTAFSSSNGNIIVSVAHSSYLNLDYLLSSGYDMGFFSASSGQEVNIKTYARGERYAWVVLNITEGTQITSVNHTYWKGFNTLYNHEPYSFSFAGSFLPYRVMYPKNFNASLGIKYPLIISTSGSDGTGSNNIDQMSPTNFGRHMFLSYYNNPEFDAFSVVVQIPDSYGQMKAIIPTIPLPFYNGQEGQFGKSNFVHADSTSGWTATNEGGFFAEATAALAKEFAKNPNIDSDRIYFTGFSYGGKATYELMKQMNNTLAAAWAVAGWPIGMVNIDYTNITRYSSNNTHIVSLKNEVQRYKNIPLLATAGESDTNVGPWGGQIACREINAAGGDCDYILYPGASATHNYVATNSYSDISQIRWLLSQRKNN